MQWIQLDRPSQGYASYTLKFFWYAKALPQYPSKLVYNYIVKQFLKAEQKWIQVLKVSYLKCQINLFISLWE